MLEAKASTGRVVVGGEMSFPSSWGISSLTILKSVLKLHKLFARISEKTFIGKNNSAQEVKT